LIARIGLLIAELYEHLRSNYEISDINFSFYKLYERVVKKFESKRDYTATELFSHIQTQIMQTQFHKHSSQ